MAANFSWANLLWANPEFVRHRRAELRPVRAITVAVVVLFLCALLGLACWSYQQNELATAQRGAEEYATQAWQNRLADVQEHFAQKTWLLFYRWLIGIQGIALTFWTLFSCAQSVSGERDRKTWDFQRTTRLAPVEILTGKLLGEPVLVYFAVLCAAPITFIAGLAGGISFATVTSVFVFLAATSVFLGLGGMWLSTLLESRTRGVGLIGALALYGLTLGAYGMRDGGLPGLAAMSPLLGFIDILGASPGSALYRFPAVLFGHTIPWLLMCVLLCGSFSGWLALMLVRNLKRDYPEIRPLSRWQAVGCAAFLNFLIYALLRPAGMHDTFARQVRQGWFSDASSVAIFAVAMNGLILFLMGLATLTPQERLKVWRRKRTTGESKMFADDGLPWPWLVISGVVAYALMVWGLLAWDHALPLQMHTLQTAALCLLVVLVFVTRDVLFLQWCMLTRLRQPVVKGFMFLCLYYAAAAVIAGLAGVSSTDASYTTLALLTPVRAFDSTRELTFSGNVIAGLVLQSGVIGVILVVISNRLQRPMQSGAAA
ncbi:MAG TPA: ABC transporter permease subunit [Terriglobales bacterium]|nr:ABC transporter permease subunit [Terriglobales bacterium]